ncbi:hypothetical protein BH09MYX1_BH09MYX1_34120 [soil metagenome]
MLLGYVAYALCHMAVVGRFKLRLGLLPGPDLLLVLLSIVTLRLFADYMRSPPAASRRTIHFLVAPLLFGPALAALALLGIERPSDYGDPDALSTWLLFLREQTSRIGLAVVLPTFVWLVVGRRMRDASTIATVLSPLPLARDGLRVIGAASRDWLALVLTIYAYSSTEASAPLFGDADDLLKHVDRLLFFGHDPNLLLERAISPALSEWMAGCYVFYVLLFPIAMGVVYATDQRKFTWFAFSVALTLALGYVGYSIVPAQGPVFTTHFTTSLDLYYLAPVKEQLMDRLRVPRDCFPSLHTAASLTLLRGIAKSAPKLALALAPIVLTIPIACVYLRYHYVTDVLAGILLFACVAKLTDRLAARDVQNGGAVASVPHAR